MNRKDRRAQTKILQKTAKISRADAKKLVEMKYSHYPLEEGTKVKLNWELIKRHPDWKIQRKDYKEWVEAHKDEVFTVEWDENRKRNNTSDKKFLVCLKEDETDPKWLFYSSTLIPLPVATVKLDDGTEKDIVINDANDIKSTDRIQNAINEALEREKENK